MQSMRVFVMFIAASLCVSALAQPRLLTTGQLQPQAKSFYFQCKGAKQGQFASEGPTPRWAGYQVGLDLEWRAEAPVDRATGLATGRTQLVPLVIVRPVGPASPLFLAALASNEMLPQVTIQFPQNDAAATVWYEITLQNARVASLRQYLAVPPGGNPAGPLQLLEAITLRYQKITIRHVPTNREAVADNGSA